MRDLNFHNAGCEPTARGPRAVLAFCRRGLRKVLRPMFVRLTQILDSIVAHLDQVDGRLDRAEARVDVAEGWISGAGPRLDRAEWNARVLHQKADGMAAHLAGLSGDHLALHDEVRTRAAQLAALSASVAGANERLDETDDRLRAFQALHWDHVALARRLAVIEDLLAAAGASDGPSARPSVPFPGLERAS